MEKAQRAALAGISGCMPSAPTRALEAILNIPPVRLKVLETALCTMHRLKQRQTWYDRGSAGHLSTRTHRTVLSPLWTAIPEVEWPCDMRGAQQLADIKFAIDIKDRDWWKDSGDPVHDIEDVVCYTDGSRHEDRTGAAFVVMADGEVYDELIPLGEWATVFQAEVIGIIRVADSLAHLEHPRNVHIYSDSLSTLLALQTFWGMTRLVQECFESLQTLCDNHRVTLHWVPAHVGIHGNELADTLAKTAASTLVFGPEPICAVSPEVVKTAIRTWTTTAHRLEWERYHGAQLTKTLCGPLPSRKWEHCVQFDRMALRNLLQVIMGHSNLNHHLHRIGRAESNLCPSCGMTEETSEHFLTQCDMFATKRMDLLGDHPILLREVQHIGIANLLYFIRGTGRFLKNVLQ